VKKVENTMEVTCFVKREGSQYASLCVDLDVASCGRTKKEAIEGLKRAIDTYIEYMVMEGRENEIYRPVPMKELKSFMFPEEEYVEQNFKAIPLNLEYA
jgi:predicted RNase H-like HicB family nuclease